MDSSSLHPNGITTWHPFRLSAEKQLLASLPRESGVYAIRSSASFGRFRGLSDIVCIGSSRNKNGLRRRIRFYFRPGPTQNTSQRIHAKLGDLNDLEITWHITTPNQDPRALEKSLLAQYEQDHQELPPLSRQG